MEESTINGADFRAARRELRGAMRGLAEGKVLAVIPMSSGGEIRVSVFAERGRPPLVSIGLCHRAGEDFIPDGKRASSRGASSRSRSPSCTRTAGWPPMVMSGASACRGGGQRNADSARKPTQTRPGRLPTRTWPRASSHPRRRLQPNGPSPEGQ